MESTYNFGYVLHIDIGYGCNADISGVKYALFVVDRATHYTCMYSIKSIKDDSLPIIQQLLTDISISSKKIVTGLYHELIGQALIPYLNMIHYIMEFLLPKYQHRNGLVKCNMRTLVIMARG